MVLHLLLAEYSRPIELMTSPFEASQYTNLLGFSAPNKIAFNSSTTNSPVVFNVIESSLIQLSSSESKLLQASPTLLATLETITGSLPANLALADFSHIERVIERSFPGHQAAVFSKLIMQHYQYYYHPQYLSKNASTSDLDSPIARQQHYFDDFLFNQLALEKNFAAQLFKDQNQLRQYLNRRKEIRENQKLSNNEKQQRLKFLEATYKQHRLSES